jgi:hypothetical protein
MVMDFLGSLELVGITGSARRRGDKLGFHWKKIRDFMAYS